MLDTTAPPRPPGEQRRAPPSAGRVPQPQPGPQMYALWHHRGPACHRARRPPRPPARPPPPPTQPSTHHTGCRPPTPHGLRVFRRHRGPARHRAPGKNAHPNGRRNKTSRSTTQPQHSGSTKHHLLGGEPCPATRIRRPQAPGPSNPSAPCTRKRAQARALQATQVHNTKHHPTRPHAATSQQPRHRPSQRPTRTTVRQSDRRRAPHTRRPTALPHRHLPLRRLTPPEPSPNDPSAPCAPRPTSPPATPVPKLQRHPARRRRDTIRRAPAQAEPAPQQRHDPPAGPAVRPTETPSGSHPGPSPYPDLDPRHATVPADDPLANAPGCELVTGLLHPEGGTPAARLAAAEGNGGTRALAGHLGGLPRPAPAPDDQTQEATQIADNAATSAPALPAQPQREEPTVDATEEAGGPPQRKEAPLPAADLPARGPPRAEIPSGVRGQPKNQHASTLANRLQDMAARESSGAPDAGQPGTGPGELTPDAGHAAVPPPPTTHGAQTTGHASAAPSAAPAYRSNAGAGGRHIRGGTDTGPTSSPGRVGAWETTSDTPKRAADRGTSPGGHTRDEDCFDSFMESCRSAPHTDPTPAALHGHPEPRDDHTGGAPLTVSR